MYYKCITKIRIMGEVIKDGFKFKTEIVDDKNVLAIYDAQGKRVQLDDLESMRDSLAVDLKEENKLKDIPSSFSEFLKQVDFSEFVRNKSLENELTEDVMSDLIEALNEDKFIINVKSRQIFGTTLFCLYSIWKAYHGENVLLLSHNQASSEDVKKMMFQMLNCESIKKALKFNQSSIKNDDITFMSNGHIKMRTTTKDSEFRGHSIDLLIFDEFSFFDKQETAYEAIESCLSKDSQVIISSTPYTKDDLFYELYATEKISKKNGGLSVSIIDKAVARNYKFKKEDIILKFKVPALESISQYKVVALDDIYYRDEKIVDKFTVMKISQKYRDNIQENSKMIDLLVSIKIPTQEPSPKAVNCGYDYDIEKFGIDFALVSINSEQSFEKKIVEIPFYKKKNQPLLMETKVDIKRRDLGSVAADKVERLFEQNKIGESGYEILDNGKLIFDMNKFTTFGEEQEIHTQLNCKFLKIPLKSSKEGKTVSMRMNGEMLSRINEKIDEVSILVKREVSFSDYIRGLIKKDLD